MLAQLELEGINKAFTLMEAAIQSFQLLDTPAKHLEYLGTITSLQSLSTEVQASCKYWMLEEYGKELDRQAKLVLNKEGKIPASIAKIRAESNVREWIYRYEKAQRYSAAVSHTIDSIRTKISYIKQELDNSKYSNAA